MKPFYKILIAVNTVILIFVGISFLVINNLRENFALNHAARTWGGGVTNYSQVSVYFGLLEGLNENAAYSKRQEIQKKLIAESTIPKESEFPQWIDCAACSRTCDVYLESKKVECIVTGTWGDYFVFHPEQLLYGCYYDSGSDNIDQIVLDDNATWQLFGGINTVGMTVMIEGRNYRISGIVKSPSGKIAEKAYGNTPRVYMPFESLTAIDEYMTLSSYEMCMPEKVKGYAASIAQGIFKEQFDRGDVVDQTHRFELVTLVANSSDIKYAAMRLSTFSYPWRENCARAAELICQILALPSAILLIITAVSLVVLMFVTAKLIGRFARFILKKMDDHREKRLRKAYAKKRAAMGNKGL